MTPREIALYRWLETFSLHPVEDAENPFYTLALHRKYVEKKRAGEVVITPAAWDWFAGRCATIITRCNAGHHDYRPKTAFCEAPHCMWCGHCETRPCQECRRVYMGGTIEGGWNEPLDPTHDDNPRSTIHNGYA